MGRPRKERRQAQAAHSQSEDRLWSIGQLAEYLGLPVATIYQWRYRGKGPTAHRIGKHIRFRRVEVERWLEAHKEVRDGAH